MKPMLGEFKFLKTVVQRLNKAGIPYMITGSVAMNYYAQPRMTRDVDIVVEIKPEDVKGFYNLFEDDFYIDLNEMIAAVRNQGIFNVIDLEEVFKVDFIVQKEEPFRKLEFERRKKIEIDGITVFLVSSEDLILSKLLWGRKSHSELQLRDVRNLLQTKVDLEYVGKWAKKLKIEKLLKEALGEGHE